MTDEPFDLAEFAAAEAAEEAMLLAAEILASATRMEQAKPDSREQTEAADQTMLLILQFERIETLPAPSRLFAMARISARLLNGLADKSGSDGAVIARRYSEALKAQRSKG